MITQNNNFISIIQNINFKNRDAQQKEALINDISTALTHRILIVLVDNATEEKRETFIKKINENKDEPSKIISFADYFVENSTDIINEEIKKYTEDIQNIIAITTPKN